MPPVCHFFSIEPLAGPGHGTPACLGSLPCLTAGLSFSGRRARPATRTPNTPATSRSSMPPGRPSARSSFPPAAAPPRPCCSPAMAQRSWRRAATRRGRTIASSFSSIRPLARYAKWARSRTHRPVTRPLPRSLQWWRHPRPGRWLSPTLQAPGRRSPRPPTSIGGSSAPTPGMGHCGRRRRRHGAEMFRPTAATSSRRLSCAWSWGRKMRLAASTGRPSSSAILPAARPSFA